jgi:hypothetical protein
VFGEFFVDPGFELRESAGQLLVRAEQIAELYEGAYDVDTHGDCTRRVENIGGLDRAVFGEGPR